MSTDRDETLRRGEGLVRQGRLDAAIAEYARIVEQYPNDVATANTLGDLYVRVAQSDRAVPLFMRIADSYFRDGFYSKAAGFYKKILKFQPQDEPTLLRLVAVSLQLGHGTEARGFLQPVLARRRQRRDDAGVDEVLVLLGRASPDDIEARTEGARAALRLQGKAACAGARETAEWLAERGLLDDALRLLEAAIATSPGDTVARARLVRWCIDRDELPRARAVLGAEGVPADVALNELRVEIDAIEAARRAEPEPPTPPPPVPPAKDVVAGAASHGVASASRPTPGPDADGAAGRVQTVGVLRTATEVDLTAALDALAEAAASAPAASGLASAQTATGRVAGTAQGAGHDAVSAREAAEAAGAADDDEPGGGTASLDHVFDEARREMAEAARHEGRHLIELAATYQAAGLTDNAIETLAQAARDPRARAEASRRMAAIRLARGEHAQAVEWLERAAESAEAGPARDGILRELARALDAAGEAMRALAVWLEVQAATPDDDEARAAVQRLCQDPFGGGAPSAR